jgi:hypothetical protein
MTARHDIDRWEWVIPPRYRTAVLTVALLGASALLAATAVVWPASPVATPIESCFGPGWRDHLVCQAVAPAEARALPDDDDVWTAALIHQRYMSERPLPEDAAGLVDRAWAGSSWLQWYQLSAMRSDLDQRDEYVSLHGYRGANALEIADITARSHRLDETAAWRALQPEPFASQESTAVLRARRSWVASALTALAVAILGLGLGLFRWQRSVSVELTQHALRVGRTRILLEHIEAVDVHDRGVRVVCMDGTELELGPLAPALLDDLVAAVRRLAGTRAEAAYAERERRRLASIHVVKAR